MGQLPEEYFERVRGLQPDIGSGADGELVDELLRCANCKRKAIHFRRPQQKVGVTVQLQYICPKCRREITNTVSLRIA